MRPKNGNLFWEGQKIFWEKEKNAGYQHFLLFPKCYSKGFRYRAVKNYDCVVVGLTHYQTTILDWSKLKQILKRIQN